MAGLPRALQHWRYDDEVSGVSAVGASMSPDLDSPDGATWKLGPLLFVRFTLTMSFFFTGRHMRHKQPTVKMNRTRPMKTRDMYAVTPLLLSSFTMVHSD